MVMIGIVVVQFDRYQCHNEYVPLQATTDADETEPHYLRGKGGCTEEPITKQPQSHHTADSTITDCENAACLQTYTAHCCSTREGRVLWGQSTLSSMLASLACICAFSGVLPDQSALCALAAEGFYSMSAVMAADAAMFDTREICCKTVNTTPSPSSVVKRDKEIS